MAAAFGRPVVVTDVGELGEVARATGMGLVVPPASAEALAAAIRRCFAEPSLAEALSRGSLRAANGLLSAEHVAGRAGQVYAAAIEQHPRRRLLPVAGLATRSKREPADG
jgi:glycosyltransferase involved in cell wall biosynthesis